MQISYSTPRPIQVGVINPWALSFSSINLEALFKDQWSGKFSMKPCKEWFIVDREEYKSQRIPQLQEVADMIELGQKPHKLVNLILDEAGVSHLF